MKEVQRQFKRLRDELGFEFRFEAVDSIERVRKDLLAGRITPEEAERWLNETDELIARAARESEDPAIVTILDTENEAKARGLSEVAQLLGKDAARAAAIGQSKQQWIAEVLDGHSDDEGAQLACLKHIVALWSDGPWPWPRDEMT